MAIRIKRLIAAIVIFILCMGFTVSAKESVSLTLPNGFYIHSKEPKKTAEILGMTESELSEYCLNGSILYLAVDEENLRQIRVTVGENGFSNSIVNISELTDSKIESLAPEISGIEGVRGEAVSLNGQKFLKVELQSNDSGGDYILTQYITVAERQNIVLSFYTDSQSDTDYIGDVFDSFSSPMFINNEAEKKVNIMLAVIPFVAVGFALAGVGLVISIIIDVKRHGTEDEDFEEEEAEDFTDNEDTADE